MSENKEVEVKEKKMKIEKVEKREQNQKGEVEKMEVKQLVKEIETKKVILMEEVFRWSQSLSPVKDVHVKLKGRYYPLIEKETGKLSVIDKVQGKKLSFNSLDQNMKFAISAVLAERKEEIEKEVEEGKKKFLEKKLEEIDKLLSKF